MANIIFYINALKARCVYARTVRVPAHIKKRSTLYPGVLVSYIFGPPAEQWIDHNQTHSTQILLL